MNPQDKEAAIRADCERGAYDAAATEILECYGGEILSFLVARLRSESDGHEAFSMWCEDLWTGLSGFEFRASVRTWLYVLARNAANRYATAPACKAERNLAFSEHAPFSHMVHALRSSTHGFRQTEVKDKVRALRDQLEPEDQTLLILRIDRGLEWRDLAVIMCDLPADAEELPREAARLRKRFERVKEKLRALARDQGLV